MMVPLKSTLTGRSRFGSAMTVTTNRLRLDEPLTKTPSLSCVWGVVGGPSKDHPEAGHGLDEPNWLMSAMQTVPPIPTVTLVE
jgi:hypothetical protein